MRNIYVNLRPQKKNLALQHKLLQFSDQILRPAHHGEYWPAELPSFFERNLVAGQFSGSS